MHSGLLESLSSHTSVRGSILQACIKAPSVRGSYWDVTGTLRTSPPSNDLTSENSELLGDLGYPSFNSSHISIAPPCAGFQFQPHLHCTSMCWVYLKVNKWLGSRSTHSLRAVGRWECRGLRQQRPQLFSTACFSDRAEWSDLAQCSQFYVANTKKDLAIRTHSTGDLVLD